MNYYYTVYYKLGDKSNIDNIRIRDYSYKTSIRVIVDHSNLNVHYPYCTMKVKDTNIIDMINNKRYISCHDIFDILVKEDVKLLISDKSNILTNATKPR